MMGLRRCRIGSRRSPPSPPGGPTRAWGRVVGALAGVSLVAALGACGPQGSERAPGATPSSGKPSSASAGDTQMMIGPLGGTLAIQAGPAKGTVLIVPPGALSKMVRISTRMTSMAATDLPRGVMSTGPVLDFQPDGLKFAKPAFLTIPFSRPSDSVYTRSAGERQWTKVPGAAPDSKAQTMIAQINHFTSYTTGKDGVQVPVSGGEGVQPNDPSNTPDKSFILDPTWPTVGLVLDPNTKIKKCVATLMRIVGASPPRGGTAITMKGCAQKDDVLYFPFDAVREGNPPVPASGNPRKDYTVIAETLERGDDNVVFLALVHPMKQGFPADLKVPTNEYGFSAAPSAADKNATYSTAFADTLWGNLGISSFSTLTDEGISVDIPPGPSGCPAWGTPLLNDQNRLVYGLYVGGHCGDGYTVFLASKNHANAWSGDGYAIEHY